MISSLVRWFRRGVVGTRSGRAAGSARRFAPRLEALEVRAVPSVVAYYQDYLARAKASEAVAPSREVRAVPSGVVQGVWSAAVLGTNVGGPSHVIPFGSKPGGVGDG
jgi:hypothetical protein